MKSFFLLGYFPLYASFALFVLLLITPTLYGPDVFGSTEQDRSGSWAFENIASALMVNLNLISLNSYPLLEKMPKSQ